MDTQKTPIYKRKWFIILCILVVIGAIGNMNKDTTVEPVSSQSKPAYDVEPTPSDEDAEQDKNIEPSEPEATQKTSEPDESTTVNVTLGLTLEEFRTRLNKNYENLDSDKNLAEIEWPKGELAAQGIINDNLSFSFVMSSDHEEIVGIIFIGAGDGTPESGVDIIFSMSAAMMAVDPSIQQEDSGTLVLDLLDEEKDQTLSRNGIKYSVTNSPELGILLTIEPAY